MKSVILKTGFISLTLLLLFFTSSAFIRKSNCNLSGPVGVAGKVMVKTPQGKIPEIFAPGIISTEHHEFSCSFSPDGKEFYFTRRVPEFNRNRILVTKFQDGGWSNPKLADKAGDYEGIEPYITPDNKKFYFQSWRPINSTAKPSFDIWVMNNSGQGWGDPVHLGSPFNPMKAMYLSMTEGGKIYTTDISDNKGKSRIVIINHDGKDYSGFRPLPEMINATGTEFYPCISLKEKFLLFTRTGEQGKSAIYISLKGSGNRWMPPKKVELGMGNVTMPRLSPDEKYLFFTHVPERLKGDIYRVDAKIIGDLRPKELNNIDRRKSK